MPWCGNPLSSNSCFVSPGLGARNTVDTKGLVARVRPFPTGLTRSPLGKLSV